MPDALTLRLRRDLWRLRAETIRGLRELWPRWDPTDEGTWERFAGPATLLVLKQSRRAAALGAVYYAALRQKQTGSSGRFPGETVSANPEAIATSLGAVGLAGTYTALKYHRRTLAQAKAVAFVRVTMAAARHVAGGARETVALLSEVDDASVGWARVTAGTCAFCAELASEGVTAKTTFQAHDGCQCVAEPTFKAERTAARGTTEADREAWLKELASRPGVTGRDLQTLRELDSRQFYPVNEALRSNDLQRKMFVAGREEAADFQASRIDRLFRVASQETREDVIMYRGIDEKVVAKLRPGQAFFDDGYSFTTNDLNKAHSFSAGAVLRIRVPAGKRYLLGNHTYLSEYIFKRGTKFRVIDVTEDRLGFRRVVTLVME
jgi:hypothetical protein